MARIFKNRGIKINNNPCTSQYQIKHQKLENQRNRGKALSLDPHKLPSEEEQEEEEEEEEENDNNPKNQIFHGHSLHPYLQQLHEQTLLYSGLDRLNNPNPPLSIPPPPPSTTATQPVKKRSFYNPSSSSSHSHSHSHSHDQNNEHARLCEKMGTGDTLNNNNLNPVNTQSNPSRLGLRHSAGEIVEVQGGHIVRSIGRKDRHSKVCTAKGPRDRRVRLSAHTAIQFYDVQDRLGYDRPSKAVDWLIKKAKASIDQLAELPAWHPTTAAAAGNSNFDRRKQSHEDQSPIPVEENAFQQMGNNNPNSSFLPPSMDSDSIADTIKSFFPTGASTEHNINNPNSSNSIPFHNFQTQTQNRTQDLRLSLQSFQDPDHNNLFTGTQLGFDPSNTPWSDQQHSAEINRFQRLIAWNNTAGYPSGSSGGFLFNPPPPPPPPPPVVQPMLQPLFGQNQFISQRGPLQSSNTQSVRAWIDPSSSYDNHHLHQSIPIHPSSFSSIGYSSGGFRIPARIQGEDEEHDGISDKPSSASSDSRH